MNIFGSFPMLIFMSNVFRKFTTIDMYDGMHLRKVVDECDDFGYRQSDNKMLGNPPISRPYAIIEYLKLFD